MSNKVKLIKDESKCKGCKHLDTEYDVSTELPKFMCTHKKKCSNMYKLRFKKKKGTYTIGDLLKRDFE
jgi:hypothetical protein